MDVTVPMGTVVEFDFPAALGDSSCSSSTTPPSTSLLSLSSAPVLTLHALNENTNISRIASLGTVARTCATRETLRILLPSIFGARLATGSSTLFPARVHESFQCAAPRTTGGTWYPFCVSVSKVSAFLWVSLFAVSFVAETEGLETIASVLHLAFPSRRTVTIR